jgi:hypothetical protein
MLVRKVPTRETRGAQCAGGQHRSLPSGRLVSRDRHNRRWDWRGWEDEGQEEQRSQEEKERNLHVQQQPCGPESAQQSVKAFCVSGLSGCGVAEYPEVTGIP